MKSKWLLLLLAGFALSACSDDDDTPQNNNRTLTLDFNGLKDVGASQRYEGWIIVNGNPISTGTFIVNSSGTVTASTFQVNKQNLEAATAFVLTIEPHPDTDPAPSKIKVLAGDFTNGSAQLRVSHPLALGIDFTGVNGKYLLATPTTADTTDEKRGIWFIDNSTGTMMPGLTSLPDLGNDWKYEGWVMIDGIPVTTGTFKTAAGADDAAPYSGPDPGPAFPGEDLIMNPPAGVTFPNDLSGKMVMVSVEPFPDNSPNAFLLRPLTGTIPTDAMKMTSYDLTNQVETVFPTGTAAR